MKISRDVNGNKILKIESKDITSGRGFSIHTLGNLPETHREGIFYNSKNEIFEYIRLHGTDKQKTTITANSEFSLLDMINGVSYGNNTSIFKTSLDDNDLDQLINIICKGCRHETKSRIRSLLEYDFDNVNMYGVKDRFFYNPVWDRWSYCAGQDYVSEMKSVRESLLK